MSTIGKDIKHIKRRRILRTAAQLFASRHYHEVNTDDIARHAKIAKGSLYNYFKSKEDLYYAIITEGLDQVFDQFATGTQSKGHSFLEINRFILNLYYVLCKNKFIFQVFQKEEWRDRSSREGVVEKFDALKGILRGLLNRGISSGQMRPVNVEVAVELIFGMVESLVKRVYGGIGQREDILEVFNILLEGIGTKEDKEQVRRYSNYLFMHCLSEWNNCYDRISKRTFFQEEIKSQTRSSASKVDLVAT